MSKKQKRKIKNKWEGIACLLEKVFEYDWFGHPIKKEDKRKLKKKLKQLTKGTKI